MFPELGTTVLPREGEHRSISEGDDMSGAMCSSRTSSSLVYLLATGVFSFCEKPDTRNNHAFVRKRTVVGGGVMVWVGISIKAEPTCALWELEHQRFNDIGFRSLYLLWSFKQQ
ncbi:hypothetical protein HNY73_011334 [Argiope bruennichi]|nr:hypothetical protein HNY73_011334 [Argiope bruennichi]